MRRPLFQVFAMDVKIDNRDTKSPWTTVAPFDSGAVSPENT